MGIRQGTIRLPGSMKRSDQAELLDLGEGSSQEVAENLAEMQRINRLLGGARALYRHLCPRLLRHTHSLTLLDLGTGAAALPADLLRWSRRQGLSLRVLAVDWSRRNLRAAEGEMRHSADVLPVQANALCLPMADRSVDYVFSTLFMHHLTPHELQVVLAEAVRVARYGLVMSDLVRGWQPLLGFRLIQPFLARNRLTRHDGALSIRRAYRPAELQAIARQAGLAGGQVITHFPWRMTLVVDR